MKKAGPFRASPQIFDDDKCHHILCTAVKSVIDAREWPLRAGAYEDTSSPIRRARAAPHDYDWPQHELVSELEKINKPLVVMPGRRSALGMNDATCPFRQ